MIAIKKYEDYLAFNIEEIGLNCLNSLLKKACKISNKVSVDNIFDAEEQPSYKTQIPYNSGYIQERFVYYCTNSLINYILTQAEGKGGYDLFFCNYPCLDLYDNNNLIISINIVQDIVSVNATAIDLTELEGDLGNG